MKFVCALSLIAGAFATSIGPESGIPADSKHGLNLLSKARRLDEEVDITWVANYDIKFQGCHHVSQWNAEVQDEEDVRIETKRLVRFRLCPSGYCSDESGSGCKEGYGDYIVDMNEYVNAFMQMKQEYEEQKCQAYEEAGNCYCDEADDEETCMSECFYAANMGYCVMNEGDLDVNEYLECAQYDPPEGYYRRKLAQEEVEYFLGPYCADQGGQIHMGLFEDDTCTNFADQLGYGGATTFSSISNGASLPYSSASKSLVDSACWSCKQVDENAYYNAYAEVETTEFCEMVYQEAGKCETYLSYGYNENACTYLEGIKMTRKNGIIISGTGSKNKVAAAFIGIFAVSFVLLGSYVYYLKSKLDRGRIHLSD